MKFRALIRGVKTTDDKAIVVIPQWDWRVNIEFSKNIFPDEIIENINTYADYRFYGKVNLDAENVEDLEISDIEIPEKREMTILEKCVEQFIDRFKGCEEWKEFKRGEEKFALFCHSQFSGGIGMKIRNELGLYEDDNKIKDWFYKWHNCKHPDDISHIILVHIHRQILKNLEKDVK